ncbi:MAG: ferrochelatase, partial [Myxococcota bacterium]
APRPREVRRYLREFLSDPRVLDIPAWRRFLLLELLILPRRARASAAAYRTIWTAEGSPLLVNSRALAAKVQARLGEAAQVELAMRYGNPSIAGAFDRFARAGVNRLVLFPLYPQYSSAATGSSIARGLRLAAERWNTPFVQVIPPFFDHPAYLDARAASLRPLLAGRAPERVLFSFHGLPERQIRRGDPDGRCLARADCCAELTDVNRSCYRAQCHATARLLGERLELAPERTIVCFQSRLGRAPWIRPYTDEVLAAEARRGVRDALVVPSFVADCLETVEEIGIRARDQWRALGGEELLRVDCLNAHPTWVEVVAQLVLHARGTAASERDAAVTPEASASDTETPAT